MNMNRKLVTVQKIKKLYPIKDADRIEVAEILGWKVVVEKGKFKENELVLFFEVDSFLPKLSQYQFLGENNLKKMNVNGQELEGYRLRTVKLKGQISQGLALPISAVFNTPISGGYTVGQDVTAMAGVFKYEPPMSASLAGVARGPLPGYIPKTDEIRIQACPDVLTKYQNVEFYVTEKVDGSSTTFFLKDDELHVCSRSLDLKETEGNSIWKMAKELDLEEKLRKMPSGLVLQGEILGEKLQGNKLKLTGHKIMFFNAFNYIDGKYYDYEEFKDICKELELETVPIIDVGIFLPKTIDEIVKYATRKSLVNPNVWVEGIVLRPLNEMKDEDIGRLSFKVINPEFLLEFKE